MNEKVKRVSWEDCEQDGEITLFEDMPFTGVLVHRYEKQKVWEQEFKDGIKHGLYTEWDEDGKKTLERYFSNGNKQGLWRTLVCKLFGV